MELELNWEVRVFFSNNFISHKIVFLWLILIPTTVLATELVQRSSKAEREKAMLGVMYSFGQASYKTGELGGAVDIKTDIQANIKLKMTKSLAEGL